MSFCPSCQSLTWSRMSSTLCGDGENRFIELKPSFDALEQAASACDLCALFLHAMQTSPNADMIVPRIREDPIYVCLSIFNMVPFSQVEQKTKVSMFRLALTCGWKLTTELLITAEPDDPLYISGSISGHYVDPRPDSVEQLDYFKGLVEDCRLNHQACKQDEEEREYLPTRVLDLLGGQSPDEIRLVAGVDHSGKYVALSHCWGKESVLTTTSETFAAHQRGIHTDSLPRTFQDAVTITRHFGIRFLWIDSLCIVQDDRSDWHRESATMGDVYSNADFAIAASAAENATQGCFAARETCSVKSVHLPHFGGQPDKPSSVRIVYPVRGNYNTNVEESPLQQRAWCTQELLLSPRVLHYGRTQTIFECRTAHVGEETKIPSKDGFKQRLDLFRTTAFDAPDSGPEIDVLRAPLHRRWALIVEEYSRRSLTRQDDKLTALAGLASRIARATGEEYICGLWKESLHVGLLWHAYAFPLVPAPSYRAPSWSWASRDGFVTCMLDVARNFKHTTSQMDFLGIDEVEVTDVNAAEKEGIHALPTQHLHLRLNCALQPATHVPSTAPRNDPSRALEIRPNGLGMGLYIAGAWVGGYFVDTDVGLPGEGAECVVALVARCDPPEPAKGSLGVLVLEPVGGMEGRYSRVGVGQIADVGCFDGVERRTIVVV